MACGGRIAHLHARVDPPPPSSLPATDEEILAQCRVETFRAGGPGDQHQNVKENGVRLAHLPTGIRVVVRDGVTTIPDGDTDIRVGDRLYLLAPTSEIQALPRRHPIRQARSPSDAEERRNFRDDIYGQNEYPAQEPFGGP